MGTYFEFQLRAPIQKSSLMWLFGSFGTCQDQMERNSGSNAGHMNECLDDLFCVVISRPLSLISGASLSEQIHACVIFQC